MQPQHWNIVERLLQQVQVGEISGRWCMAIAPNPLEVVLYETPVLVRSQPPQNPLRGFIQEAVLLLEEPTAAQIAALLYLPVAVVELVLGNLRQIGGAVSDAGGRWSVPDGAPRFRSDETDLPIWRRTRKLLCYWPQQQMLLPILPRMRLRDLVKLDVHNLRGEDADYYNCIATWSDQESVKRGRPITMRILPLRTEPPLATSEPSPSEAPVSDKEVLVTQCRLDVIALMWVSCRSGLWEVFSRLWSRPTPPERSLGVPFAPGEPLPGLSLPERLLGGRSTLDDLGKLFTSDPEKWRELLEPQDGLSQIRRDLNGNAPALIVAEQVEAAENRRWQVLPTCFGRDARLICWIAKSTTT